jgi:hypothetical protein
LPSILLAQLLKNKQSLHEFAPAHTAAQLLLAGLVALLSYKKRSAKAKHETARHDDVE